MKRSPRIITIAAFALALLVPALAWAVPVVNVAPSTLSFGQVVIYTTATLYVDVQNTDATSTVFVENIQLYESSASVRPSYPGLEVSYAPNYYFMNSSFTANSPIPVPPGQTVHIPINYTPGYIGQIVGTLYIYWYYDANIYPGGVAPSVTFTGEGIYAGPPPPTLNGRVSVAPTLNFGDIIMGQTGTANLVVRNAGTGDLALVYLEITGAGGFPIVSVPGSTWSWGAPFDLMRTVLPGQTASIPIGLKPVALGPINGSILLYTDDPTTNFNGVPITFAGNVINQPTPVAAIPAPLPEIPGISFFYESTVVGDSVDVGLFLKWKVIWLDDSSVVWDLGNGRTAKGMNVRAMMPLGVDTVKVSARDIRGDSTCTAIEVLTFAKPVAAAIAPTTPVAEVATPVFTTGTVGSDKTISATMAGGGGKKRPKRQVVPAPPVAKLVAGAGVQGASWGAIKNLQE